MKRYDHLLFVCKNDTCRAPLAKFLMQNSFLLEQLTVDSRGLVVLFPEPLHPRAEQLLEKNHIPFAGHYGQELKQSDFHERTLILTMKEEEKQQIFEEHENVKNVFLFSEYVGLTGDINSPYGGTMETYESCYRHIEQLVKKLVLALNEEELLC